MRNISQKDKNSKSPKSLDSSMEEEESEVKIKQEDSDDSDCNSKDEYNDTYPTDLPLEVITTVQPFNYNYPILKNMSNGVLTHRNIFTETEREILTRIVDKYRDIVDTRSRTREIYLEKQTVWQQIVEEYNSTDNVIVRTEKELRKCWDNMKYRARLAVKEKIKTEGVKQETKSQMNDHLDKVMSGQSSNSSVEMSTTNSDLRDTLADAHGNYSDDTSSHNYSEEDDDAPAFKKARQESPKLSSLLLGEGKSSSRLNNSEQNIYGILDSAKTSYSKKKVKDASSLVNILPKGLHSSLSVMNIPNPYSLGSGSNNSDVYGLLSSEAQSGSINLGGGITISPQMNHNTVYENLMKPLPNLKRLSGRKVLLNKNNANRSDGIAYPLYQEGYCNESDSRNDLECKAIVKRLMMDEKEHQLRIKLLEKKVQAFSSESQYWTLKLKLLKAAKDNDISSLTNGNV